mgnify:CR=1 FL=1
MQTKKIMRFTPSRRRQLIETYISWGPAKLASYYNNMGRNERSFVEEEIVPKYSEKDQQDFEFYRNHPIERREALAKSELEQKAG